MPRCRPLLLLLGGLIAGCGTTHQRQRPQTVEQLEQQIGTDAVWPGSRDPNARDPVTLLYQPTQGAPALPPAAEASARGAGGAVADVSQIRGYEVKRRMPGALQGLLIGAASGAVGGATYGFSRGDDPACDFCLFNTAEDKAILGAVAVGMMAGAVGAVIGAIIGRTDLYLF